MGTLPGFFGIEDTAAGPFEERRPGCGKRVIAQADGSQASIYRLEPGASVPAHHHTRADDLFVGLHGEVLIRAEGATERGSFILRPGRCCHVAHGVRHEVLNTSQVEVALFVLVHSPHEGFDLVS